MNFVLKQALLTLGLVFVLYPVMEVYVLSVLALLGQHPILSIKPLLGFPPTILYATFQGSFPDLEVNLLHGSFIGAELLFLAWFNIRVTFRKTSR